MRAIMQRLYEKLEDRLREIQSESFPLLKETSQCINVCQETLQELRKMVEKNQLKDSKEEIEFFKEIKPKFYSQFIYYVKVFHIEINRPAASDKVQISYLESHLNRIKHFFDNNLDFYQYYRSGATHFDEVYFIRGQEDVRLLPDDLTLSIDHSFSTTQSYKVSKLFAYELLRIYLNTAISSIQLTDPPEPKNIEKKLQWTGAKVSLIELIYSLQTAGVINNGTADIKLLTNFFERTFQVDLGNVYNVFQEMRIRKKNRSSFLDQLKERLIQRMDEADEDY
ncbi:MAG: RteC domain-containing protein [Chitinophagales bacterium]|nr:RteC domain-containing protein [Chitinophagales bacterium]